MSISLSTKIQTFINELVLGETTDTVAEPGDGFAYVFDISQREFGTLLYTKFDETTRFPLHSYSVKYGHQHIIHQAIYSPMIRKELSYILTDEIPGEVREDFDPLIIPTLGRVYPNTTPSTTNDIIKAHKSKSK